MYSVIHVNHRTIFDTLNSDSNAIQTAYFMAYILEHFRKLYRDYDCGNAVFYIDLYQCVYKMSRHVDLLYTNIQECMDTCMHTQTPTHIHFIIQSFSSTVQ